MSNSLRGYDVFLSYHWQDHVAVESVAHALRARGLTVFLDRWYLIPGGSWPRALEEIIEACRSVAVFLGRHGMGPWQQREKDLALIRQARDSTFPVIPVLLPGADPALGFLSLNTWVDLRTGLDEPHSLAVLTTAVQGKVLGPEVQEQIQATLEAVCPYRGLLSFREEDASFFFGRGAFTERLVGAIERHNLVAVVGASGSGKSSVVRAGLIPRLRRGEGLVWEVMILVPGDQPLHTLAAGLIPLLEPEMTETDRLVEAKKLSGYLADGSATLGEVVCRIIEKQHGTNRILIVFDQWEELYLLNRDEQSRRKFLNQVLEATLKGPLSVVFTLRGDFFGHVLSYRPLADRLQDAVMTLGPMKITELERAVEAPAQKTGISFESGLKQRILDDIGEEPGNLPLLEFALMELWQARRNGKVFHDAYEAMGTVRGAIAARAEATFTQLRFLEQKAAKRVFLRLVQPGEQTEDTRRRVTFSEVGETVWSIVQRLADARLLVTGRDETVGDHTIEVAHEALIVHWARLQSWLDEDREFLLWRQRLRVTLAEWQRTKHDEGVLLRGTLLIEAERWLTERVDDLNSEERRFIRASVSLKEDERSEQERRLRRRAWTVLVAALFFLMLAGFAIQQWWRAERKSQEAMKQGVRAEEQQREAERQYKSAEIRAQLIKKQLIEFYTEQGRQELTKGNGQRALIYLNAAYQKGGREPSLRFLLARALQSIELTSLDGHRSMVYSAKYSSDGTRIVTASMDHYAKVWKANNGRLLTSLEGHGGPVLCAVFSPDGNRVVTASMDETAKVWNTKNGQPLTTLEGHEGPVLSVIFNPDGNRVVTTGIDKTVKVWDAASGRLLACLEGHEGPVLSAVFSSDGARLVTASTDETAKVWYTDGWQLLATLSGHKGSVRSVAFSPNSACIVTASADHTSMVWDVVSGELLTSLIGHAGPVLSVAFSPDGNRIVTASVDETAKMWSAVSGDMLISLNGHKDSVCSVEFSFDGTRIATASRDRTARIWDATSGHLLSTFYHTSKVVSGTFSPDGTRIVTASEDRTAKVWDATCGCLFSIDSHADPLRSVLFSPDGTRIASASEDGTIKLWDAFNGRILHSLTGLLGPARSIVFSPDGARIFAAMNEIVQVWDANIGHQLFSFNAVNFKIPVRFAFISPDGTCIVTGGSDLTAKVWNAASGQHLVSLVGHQDSVRTATFSPDGSRIVTASEDQTAKVWDIGSGKLLTSLIGHLGPVLSVSFSPDGTRVITASLDGTARVWDAANGHLIFSLIGHKDSVRTATFSPDGTRIITASEDETARIWDAANGQLLVSLVGHTDSIRTATFSPDSTLILTASDDETARVWDAISGKLFMSLVGHMGSLRAADFSPNGTHIVTASEDGTVKMWDVHIETRSSDKIEALVKSRISWRLNEGRLLPYRDDQLQSLFLTEASRTEGASNEYNADYDSANFYEGDINFNPKYEFGSFSILSRVNGVELWLGENRLGRTRSGSEMIVKHLPIGRHLLTALKSGYSPWKHEVQVVAQQQQELNVDLQRLTTNRSRAPSIPMIKLTDSALKKTVFSDRLYLEGSVIGENLITSFSVNGKRMRHNRLRQIYFGDLAPLQPGPNNFFLEVVDEFGNRNRQDITVNRKIKKSRNGNPQMMLQVTVLPFKMHGDATILADKDAIIPELLSAAIMESLLEDSGGRISLLERERLGLVFEEQNLGGSDLADPQTRLRMGKLLKVDYAILGTVNKEQEVLEISVRFVDVETGKVLLAENVYSDLRLENLLTDAKGLAWKLLERLQRIEGFIVENEGKNITINLARRDGVTKNMKLIILRDKEILRRRLTNKNFDIPITPIAEARVKSVFEDFSQAVLLQQAHTLEVKLWDRVIANSFNPGSITTYRRKR